VNVLDVNVLLYAYDETAALHESAKAWLSTEFERPEVTGLAAASLVAFVRIATDPRIFRAPFTIAEACAIVDEWLEMPFVRLLPATELHWPTFVDLAVTAQVRSALVPDADLAATAIEHGATVCTHDRDFTRFSGLRVSFPLSDR